MFGGCAYLKLVLAGLSLRRGVEEIDSENLEDNSSATEFFVVEVVYFDAGHKTGGPRCGSNRFG